MGGCKYGSNCCSSCRRGVKSEYKELFASPYVTTHKLGVFRPMMRKDTMMHRLAYSPNVYSHQIKDKDALIYAMLHRLSRMSPEDGRYAMYNSQLQQLQGELSDLKQRHSAMEQGRSSLISYATQNAGNLVPADAIGPILSGDWSSFKPFSRPVIKPVEVPEEPTVTEGVTYDPGSTTSPMASLENAPSPDAIEEAPPSEAPASAPAPSAPQSETGLSDEAWMNFQKRDRMQSPQGSIHFINSEEGSQEGQPLPHKAVQKGFSPPRMATQEEDDKNLYGLLAGRPGLSATEKAELKRILRTYPADSEVFDNEPQYTPSIASESEYEPSEGDYEPSITSESDSSYVPFEQRVKKQISDTYGPRGIEGTTEESSSDSDVERRKAEDTARRAESNRVMSEQRLYPPEAMKRELNKYTPSQLHGFVNNVLGIDMPSPKKVSDASHQRAIRDIIENGNGGRNKTAFIAWMKSNRGNYGDSSSSSRGSMFKR